MATFTHANGVEPAGAFSATVNWGDGTTSAGTITLSGTTYKVTGTHRYASGGRHTVTTTVKEAGNSPVAEGGDKLGEEDGGKSWKMQDVVHLPGNSSNRLSSSPQAAGPTASAAVAPATPTPAGGADGPGEEPVDSLFSLAADVLRLSPGRRKRSGPFDDWLTGPGA